MLSRVILQLLRLVFLGAALYGVGYRQEVYTWIFGVLFIHSLLDSKFYLKPSLMEAYLLFTVVFYFHRYVMGWGSPDTTMYKENAPDSVKVLKDVVWIAFVLAVMVLGLFRLRSNRRPRLWSSPRAYGLIFLIILYLSLPVLSFFFRRGNLFDIVLYELRYPLEYVPIVLLLPLALHGQSSIRYLRFFVPLIVISLLFLGYEILSSHATGFQWGGIYKRYGSIFGSPNDFGMFLALSMTVLLAFIIERVVEFSPKVILFLSLCLCALASTVSLSALSAMLFSGLALVVLSKRRQKAVVMVALVAALAGGLYYASSEVTVSKYLNQRLRELTTLQDQSAYLHMTGFEDAEAKIARFSTAEFLLGTDDPFASMVLPETYYIRAVYIRGLPSVVVLLSILGISILEARSRYLKARKNAMERGLFLGLAISVCSFSFASLFIPYFDIFPSNFYVWFLVAIIWSEPVLERQQSKVGLRS